MKLFVITGTCGAGKSTVKDRLSATSPTSNATNG